MANFDLTDTIRAIAGDVMLRAGAAVGRGPPARNRLQRGEFLSEDPSVSALAS
jgi:hypothetical protein